MAGKLEEVKPGEAPNLEVAPLSSRRSFAAVKEKNESEEEKGETLVEYEFEATLTERGTSKGFNIPKNVRLLTRIEEALKNRKLIVRVRKTKKNPLHWQLIASFKDVRFENGSGS